MNALSAIAPRPRAASKLKFLSLMLVAAVALGPGVYTSAATTFGITTGNLTLNGGPNAVFIFPMGSTLDTAGLTQVLLTGGAQASIVFWQVGGSATLGIDSVFAGNVLALTSITVGAGANIDGRLLAENAHVTLGGGGGQLRHRFRDSRNRHQRPPRRAWGVWTGVLAPPARGRLNSLDPPAATVR